MDVDVLTTSETTSMRKPNYWKGTAIILGIIMLILIGDAYGFYDSYNQTVENANIWQDMYYEAKADVSYWSERCLQAVEDADYWYWEFTQAKFDFYYVLPEDQNLGVYALEEDLYYGGDWIDPYQVDAFDCSEMSAYLEWELENLGWNTIIVVGDAPFGNGRHAWILVEVEPDGYMPVEATALSIVWWEDPYFDNYFDYDQSFETILDALEVYETEFNWWE